MASAKGPSTSSGLMLDCLAGRNSRSVPFPASRLGRVPHEGHDLEDERASHRLTGCIRRPDLRRSSGSGCGAHARRPVSRDSYDVCAGVGGELQRRGRQVSLRLSFTNTQRVTADTVVLSAHYGDQQRSIIDKGTFASGVEIRRAYPSAFENHEHREVASCSVRYVHYVDGAVWGDPLP
jgi:hypothetical protein